MQTFQRTLGHGRSPPAAVLAVLAAITALMAEHNANEASVGGDQGANKWGYYQAKSIKSNVVSNQEIDILEALGKPVPQKDRKKIAQYAKDQDEIRDRAEKKKARSEQFLERSHRPVEGCDVVSDRHRRGGHLRVDPAEVALAGGHRLRRRGDRHPDLGPDRQHGYPASRSESAEQSFFRLRGLAREYGDSGGEKWLPNHPRIGSHWLAKRPV